MIIKNRENHDTNHVVTADHHFTEGLDHLTGSGMAVLTVEHHHPCRGHVQRQSQQRCHQQNGREHGKIQRPQSVHADQQHHDGQGNVEREKNTSSRNGGTGNIIMASMTSSNSGTPRLPRLRSATFVRAVLIN